REIHRLRTDDVRHAGTRETRYDALLVGWLAVVELLGDFEGHTLVLEGLAEYVLVADRNEASVRRFALVDDHERVPPRPPRGVPWLRLRLPRRVRPRRLLRARAPSPPRLRRCESRAGGRCRSFRGLPRRDRVRAGRSPDCTSLVRSGCRARRRVRRVRAPVRSVRSPRTRRRGWFRRSRRVRNPSRYRAPRGR